MRTETITRRFILLIACVSWTFAMSAPARAHSVNKRFGDFYGGMFHPATSVEHLLPIVGLGLLAGQQGPLRARWVVVAFPAGLLLGACAATNAAPNEQIVWMNRISFAILGILVAAAARVPLPGLVPVSLFFGLTHGYENTAGTTQTVAMHLFVPGVLLAGLALVAIVAAGVVSLQRPWQAVAVRVAGSWIAAIGLLSLALV